MSSRRSISYLLRPFLLLFSLLTFTAHIQAASNYSDDFNDNQAQGWQIASGSWSVASQQYQTPSNMMRAISFYGGDTWNTDYTLNVTMSGLWGGSGNLAGVVLNYQDDQNYFEVLVGSLSSASATLAVNKVINGTRTSAIPAATFTSPGANTPFDLQIVRSGTSITIRVNGSAVITNGTLSGLTGGHLGVAAGWNNAKYDSFAVTLASANYSENFDDGQAQQWLTYNGAWSIDAQNRYQNAANVMRTIAYYNGATWNTGITYKAQMSSNWGGSGNLIGSVFNYQDDQNYYEVLLGSLNTPTATVTLNQVVNGTRTMVETGTVPSPGVNTMFELKIVRSSTLTNVLVNDVNVLSATGLTALPAGRVGVVAAWNKGIFDSISVTGSTALTSGPSFPRLAAVKIGSPHNYDLEDQLADIARYDVVLLNTTRLWDSSHSMTMDQVAAEVKSRNPGMRVVLYTKMNELTDPSDPTKYRSDVQLLSKVDSMNWWLRTNGTTGARVVAPAGGENYIVNTTAFVTEDGAGLDWVEWYTQWAVTNLMSNKPNVDGFYMDNTAPVAHRDGDWDLDGDIDVGENATTAEWFRDGVRKHFDLMSNLMPTKLRFANQARWAHPPAQLPVGALTEYTNVTHGGFIENMLGPGDGQVKLPAIEEWAGWYEMMAGYRRVLSITLEPKLTVFLQSLGSPTDYQGLRYGLGSCLLDNGYYAAHVMGDGYESDGRLYFDEFNVDMGQATTLPPTTAWQNGVWRRDFENAIVLVNPKGNGVQTVQLEGTYRRINGVPASVNSGQLTNTVTLQPRDGIILLKP